MVQISGKYRLESNVNFLEQLLAIGVPEEQAKPLAQEKPEIEITVNGNDITLTSSSAVHKAPTKWVLGKEVEEKMPLGVTFKSTATLEGDTLNILSKGEDGQTATRVYKFTDKGVTYTVTSPNPAVPVAVRTYVRI